MRFVIRRLLLFAAALFGISIVVFAALRVLPGDVASVMAGLNSPPERVAALRSQLGLDRPLIAQYADWIGALLHGDFGTSILTGRSISAQVGERASVTFPLIVLGLLIAMGLGIPLGCEATLARSRAARGMFHMVAIIGGAVPALWGGLLLILLFSRGTGLIGAMSCGMTRRQAVLRVGLRLAMPQLVSVIGLTFAEMVTGVMVIENLFALPGIGNGLVTDVGNRDLIAVQSELFMLAAFFLLIGLLVDLLHRVLDPRLKSADDVTEVNA